MHRLDLSLYSHPKEFFGNGVRTHVNSKGKLPSCLESQHHCFNLSVVACTIVKADLSLRYTVSVAGLLSKLHTSAHACMEENTST